ncbi:phosphate acyltransferase, partial [Bacillus mycoides]|nr:phosphate acyltransferase [Bacillus mycoides]
MRIAIDAMGRDHAPKSNVEGALAAAKEWSDVELLLVGDEAKLTPYMTTSPSN